MAQNNEQSTFSQMLGRSLLMAIPGALSGVGQGIAASDPRQPYKGFGAGLAAGIAPMAQFSGSVIDRQMANEQYDADTQRMLKRQTAVRQHAREQQAEDIRSSMAIEQEKAAADAARFRKMGKMKTGIELGMRGLDEQSKMFAAQFAASQVLPSPSMRMAGVQAARQILGGK